MNMSIKKLKGIAHDLANYLDNQFWSGYYQDLPKTIKTNVLDKKNSFDKTCVEFFKKRLPSSFNFNRIEKLILEIRRLKHSLKIEIKIILEGKNISYIHKSTKR